MLHSGFMRTVGLLGCAGIAISPLLATPTPISVTRAAGSSLAPNAPGLVVNVAGVRDNLGRIIVTLCGAGEAFPGGCKLRQGMPATKGMTRVAFRSLPAGTYAVALFHDEDGDGKLVFIKEGIGFSNDANMAYGPPKFVPSSFKVRGPTSIVINIKYLS